MLQDKWNQRCKLLLLFAVGLSAGAAFCMKWMEKDLLSGNEEFTILGLEWFYSKTEIESILTTLDTRVATILRYHLYFDFAFMAGVYPAIFALALLVRAKLVRPGLRSVLLVLALLQVIAWAFDIIENYYLLKWIGDPVIGREFVWYHFVVAVKWLIAVGAILITGAGFLAVKLMKKFA